MAIDYHDPVVRTEIPGPRSRLFLARQQRYESSARTYPRNLPIAIARAAGSYVQDVDDNVFLDFLAGAGVLSLGHNHPDVVSAVRDQLDVAVHGLDMPTPVKDRFTEMQLAMLPEPLRDRMKIHFCGPTGANGVEAAIKLCKTATKRSTIIAFQGGFHGSTAAAMAVSGTLDPKIPVGGTLPGVHFFPYSYCERCPVALNRATCDTNCAGYLERALTDPGGGVTPPAAIIMELVQGEGGVIPATREFARRVRALATDLGIPLIVDEVQTGCGRTGTWFAFEQYGIEPDVIVASKALSGVGLPVAILLYDKRLDVWEPGAHIGTFRGNQLAFAAGVAALQTMAREKTLENARARGEQLGALLAELAPRSPWIREVRGLGLMWGIELADPLSGEPATELARAVQRTALANGLILEVGGRRDSVVRMLPPLNVTAEQIETAAGILRTAFALADEAFDALTLST